MGAMNDTVRGIRDLLIEEVALRSNLLLADSDVRELLTPEQSESWYFSEAYDQSDWARIRSEEFMFCYLRLLSGVGYIEDDRPWFAVFGDFLSRSEERGIDVSNLTEAFHDYILTRDKESKSIGAEAIEPIAIATGLPNDVIVEYLIAFAKAQERQPGYGLHHVEATDWDGITPLGDLFNSEVLPLSPDDFIDQKFIDYLAVNEGRIDQINWRNFERLSAQFFKNVGFHAKLGPGRNDGGVDIRIWPQKSMIRKPPLILIQCKRYKVSNSVEVEYVKALYTDVEFENAESGMIITTSYVAPGGKKVASIRKWPLNFLENEEVRKLVAANWRHAR